MDILLRIDVGAPAGPSIRKEFLGPYAGLGGRALTSTIVAAEVPPLCHALGPENKLVIAPGLLSGTAASQSGRLSIGCKSPLTGGIKESNAGARRRRSSPASAMRPSSSKASPPGIRPGSCTSTQAA